LAIKIVKHDIKDHDNVESLVFEKLIWEQQKDPTRYKGLPKVIQTGVNPKN
jgi:hypothetical protein